jgi:hypothetical protein
MVLTPVFYINDLATPLIACHVQCRRYKQEPLPYVVRIWTGIS